MTFSDILTHLFLPHESNNHRPRLLHSQAYLFYIVFFLFFSTSLKIVNRYAPDILGVATNISITDLLDKTNQKRTEAGLSPLKLNNQLSGAASMKATDMFANNYWAHFGPKGQSPWNFIVSSGYHYSYAGENLAKDFDNSTSVVDAWMNSSTHKDNLLKKEYEDIGFAVVNGTLNGEETTLVVQMFGTSNDIVSEVIPTQAPAEDIIVAGVKTNPVINIKSVNKLISIIILTILTIILILDGYVIWKRKTIRISGHNFAHILFLTALITVVYITSGGSIL